MVKAGLIIFFVAIVTSIGIAMYAYNEYQPNFVTARAGEAIIVGPVKYVIEYEGIFNGDKDTKPEHTFMKIRILAENMNDEETRISGGQFYLIDKNEQKHEAVYGEFSSEDLLLDKLLPHKQSSYTTQFDVPFDENSKYHVGITPRKEQSSLDIGIVCILNC